MITRIPKEKRYHATQGWLSTYHLFSFADYYDPENVNFGVLRVFNDDTIDPRSGFGAHRHENMEIVTIMLDGELTHQDSMGNTGTIRPGEAQHMSAGTGVIHAEVNRTDSPVHLYQIWLLPNELNITPEYHQKHFASQNKPNELLPIASNGNGILPLHAEASIFTLILEPDRHIRYALAEHRGLFVYVTHGHCRIGDTEFSDGDQARIVNENEFSIQALQETRLLLIDVAI